MNFTSVVFLILLVGMVIYLWKKQSREKKQPYRNQRGRRNKNFFYYDGGFNTHCDCGHDCGNDCDCGCDDCGDD